jgi:hypothetical protein
MNATKWLMLVLVLGICSTTIQSLVMLDGQEDLRKEVASLRTQVDGHAEDTYFLMKSDSARLYTIMDTQIRTLHYAKPHAEPMWACPECSEIHERNKKNGGIASFNLKKKTKVNKD